MSRMPVLRLPSASLAVATASLVACAPSTAPPSLQRDESVAAPAWTGTWAASPQSIGGSFHQQTLRQIVHTSIGGVTARVQLSNAFGDQPIVVADVHLATRAGGSDIVPSSDRTVTFGGAAQVTIPVGQVAVSDSVDFTVGALSDVAVSFYLPGSTGALTGHQQGTQTNYIAGGDVAGVATWSGAQTTGSYYLLANLDVQNDASVGAVVTLGASITDGVASGQDDNRRWPNDLAARLVQSGRTVGVLNQGISGNKLLTDGAGQSALHRFARDVLAQPGVRWVIFSDDPINDLGGNPNAGPQLVSALQQLIQQAHAGGIQFFCSTLTPFEGAGYWTPTGEQGRESIDAFIRGAGSGCDAIVDQDGATHDPAHPTRYLPAYDAGDHLHPNEAGLQAIADAVDLGLFGSRSASSMITLRAHANGKYVTAENAGAQSLIANRDAIGAWEEFDEVDLGKGQIGLRAHANGKYITAERAGAQPLIANRDAIRLWETFALVHNPDGSISLRAQVNGRYVTAESAGAQSLIANRDAIGPWEEFDLIFD